MDLCWSFSSLLPSTKKKRKLGRLKFRDSPPVAGPSSSSIGHSNPGGHETAPCSVSGLLAGRSVRVGSVNRWVSAPGNFEHHHPHPKNTKPSFMTRTKKAWKIGGSKNSDQSELVSCWLLNEVQGVLGQCSNRFLPRKQRQAEVTSETYWVDIKNKVQLWKLISHLEPKVIASKLKKLTNTSRLFKGLAQHISVSSKLGSSSFLEGNGSCTNPGCAKHTEGRGERVSFQGHVANLRERLEKDWRYTESSNLKHPFY